MAVSDSSWLVLALAAVAVLACGVVGWWNLRLGRRLVAALREREALRTALEDERRAHARAQAAAAAALQAERELAGLKTRFVSLVSHEFRTPLGIIMSAGELLKNYGERLTPENQRELLEDILGSTRRMAGLMEQVLLLGRVDAGKVAARVAPIDLAGFLQKIADEQNSASSDRGCIHLETTGDLGGAQADEGLLRHIVSNLVSNAVKYSPAGAAIRLKVARAGDDAVVQVIDCGIGIPEADQPRLFEAFHRASNVGDVAGSGLGLLIVKRCVDLHGGRIEFRSCPGEGTTFTVVLPVFRAPQFGDRETDAAPRNIASRMVA